ncbi:hypothetical protein NDU88_006407, partial [Pleurodeles waltl]
MALAARHLCAPDRVSAPETRIMAALMYTSPLHSDNYRKHITTRRGSRGTSPLRARP